jgi:hypothetical protein
VRKVVAGEGVYICNECVGLCNDIIETELGADLQANQPRSREQRMADTRAKLAERHADVWVASASGGDAHLVPLSFAWTDNKIVVVTEAGSPTIQNITASRTARLALGPTRDVVVVDAEVERLVSYREAPETLVDSYRAQADWDPAQADGDFVMVMLRPVRVQAWREANEIPGRTLMRRGEWLGTIP